jgi:hypothetical protein
MSMGKAWLVLALLLLAPLAARAADALTAADEADSWWPTGDWLDPAGEAFAPRRGKRTELSAFFGGEAALGELGSLDRIPSLGGTTLTAVGRFYAVDRLGVGLGTKGYLGLAQPAAGTAAQTVLTPFALVRWDLVRENRFSLLADVSSGPAFFLFTDLFGALGSAWAVGAEGTAALAFRYTVGPVTGELRTLVGGRAGSAQEVGRSGAEVGPFSALYAGVDFGVTWSFWDEKRQPGRKRVARRGAR